VRVGRHCSRSRRADGRSRERTFGNAETGCRLPAALARRAGAHRRRASGARAASGSAAAAGGTMHQNKRPRRHSAQRSAEHTAQAGARTEGARSWFTQFGTCAAPRNASAPGFFGQPCRPIRRAGARRRMQPTRPQPHLADGPHLVQRRLRGVRLRMRAQRGNAAGANGSVRHANRGGACKTAAPVSKPRLAGQRAPPVAAAPAVKRCPAGRPARRPHPAPRARQLVRRWAAATPRPRTRHRRRLLCRPPRPAP
jgi:hypothetical protein